MEAEIDIYKHSCSGIETRSQFRRIAFDNKLTALSTICPLLFSQFSQISLSPLPFCVCVLLLFGFPLKFIFLKALSVKLNFGKFHLNWLSRAYLPAEIGIATTPATITVGSRTCYEYVFC